MTTAPTLDRPTLESELEKARRRLDDLLEQIARGDNITGTKLAAAEHDVKIAELRMHALAEHEATAAAEHDERRRNDLPHELRDFQTGRDGGLRKLIEEVNVSVGRFLDTVTDTNSKGGTLAAEAEELGLGKPSNAVVDPYQPLIEAVIQAVEAHGGMSLYDPSNSFFGLNDLRPPPGSWARAISTTD